MTRIQRILVGALALGTVIGAGPATTAAEAQVTIHRGEAPRGWLGISYVTEQQGARDARQMVRITEVVAGSPAHAAGLLAGDTVVSVNGIAATDQLLSSLAFSLAPGESVTLRVRRGGRERDHAIVTAERPAGMVEAAERRMIINTDSIRVMARVWLDSARLHLDNVRLPEVLLELPRVQILHADSMRRMITDGAVRLDSAGTRIFFSRPGGELLRADTLLRAELDSVVRRLGTTTFTMRDSAFTIVRAQSGLDGANFVAFRSAVAGAELTELDPAMESYFGTGRGVLVLRVAEETPAATAGMRAGDVIVSVNGTPVGSVNEVRRTMAEVPRATPIRIEVLRERRPASLVMPRD
jgi:C-terminal processing protease CtpA/Prc